MARTLSKDAQILVCATAQTTGTPAQLARLTAWDIDMSASEIDVTGIYDSNKQYIPGQSDCKGSFTLVCDPEDATIAVLNTARTGSTTVDLYIRLEGTGTGKEQIKVLAYITGWKVSASTDARIEISATWVAAGAIDNTAQA